VGGCVDGDEAVDRQVEGLAVDCADGCVGCGGGGVLVLVELDEAVDGVGVADKREHDVVTGVDDDVEDVGKDETEGAAGGVVNNAELTDALFSGVDVAECRGDCEAGGFGREGASGAAGCFFAVVDDLNVALCCRVDVTSDLGGEVEDEVGIAGRVAGDGERGLGVLDIAADVAQAVDDLEAAG